MGYLNLKDEQIMKHIVIPAFLFCIAFLAPRASANVATFGNSTQNVTFTGLGGNAQGEGVNSVVWGTCAFDGQNTKCTVSAPFTGVGDGGTITLLVTYPGNGATPLTATSISPDSNQITLSFTPGSGASFQVSLAESNGTTVMFYETSSFYFNFSNYTCTGLTNAACSVGQVGLTQNATISGTIVGTFDATPVIGLPQGVISASAYGAFTALAPSTWMEIYGVNLATVLSQKWTGADFNGNQAPSALGGTTVTVGGQPAFIDYVSPGQVNAQVPSTIAPGLQPVVVTTAGGSSVAFMISVNLTEPGLLAPASFNLQAGQYVTALFPNGTTFVLPPGSIPGVVSARAKPGDTIVLYGVGFGTVTPDNPAGILVSQTNTLTSTFHASFAGTPATVNYSGLTAGYLGLYQFNVVVPNVAASDSVPFTFTLGENAGTQNLVIAIQN
jgi:uncharacterized protein (TIGR03437 family)